MNSIDLFPQTMLRVNIEFWADYHDMCAVWEVLWVAGQTYE